MKILHITAQKPDFTGSGIYLSGVIEGMKSMEVSQALICGIDVHDSIGDIKLKYNSEVEIYPVVYNTDQLPFDVPGMSDNMPYPSSRYRDLTDDMSDRIKRCFSETLMEVLEKFDPDVIICHHLYYITAITREIAYDRPVFAICHGTCIRQLDTNPFEREYIKKYIPKLDIVYALHEEQRDIVAGVFNIDREKIKIIGSGYDSTIFNTFFRENKKDDEIIISYGGKLSFSKGLCEFFRALDELPDMENIRLRVMIAGDGSDENEVEVIKNMAEKCRYRVDFLGRINQRALAECFNISDIFVLPSFYEGLPLVLLEAMACGNYVISTDIPGVKNWLGDRITDSGMCSFVSLPVMKDITTPDEKYIGKFVDELRDAIEVGIKKKIGNKFREINLREMSWEGLSKKIYVDALDELYL